MIKDIENPIIKKIKKSVKHQNIGGKKIRIEKELDIDYFLDRPFKYMTIAEFNFVRRRTDLMMGDNIQKKIYYGHVENLGYFVCEDELK